MFSAFIYLFFLFDERKISVSKKNAAGTTDNIATEEKLTAYFSYD